MTRNKLNQCKRVLRQMRTLLNILLIGLSLFYSKITQLIYSETDLDQSDADIKVKVLKKNLASRQKEAKRLKAQLSSTIDKDDVSSGKLLTTF